MQKKYTFLHENNIWILNNRCVLNIANLCWSALDLGDAGLSGIFLRLYSHENSDGGLHIDLCFSYGVWYLLLFSVSGWYPSDVCFCCMAPRWIWSTDILKDQLSKKRNQITPRITHANTKFLTSKPGLGIWSRKTKIPIDSLLEL